jgi:predicted nucleotide-binding protein
MPTVDELRDAAAGVEEALYQWESSGYSDDAALQRAVNLHMKLAPVFLAIYGNVPLLVTQYPPYIILRRERDHIAQAVGALEGGLITQALLDQHSGPQAEMASNTPLDDLMAEGKAFTYESFSTKGRYGYPNELSTDWTSWTARVEEVVRPLLRTESTIRATLDEGLKWDYFGNDKEHFERGRSLIVGAVAAARDLFRSGQLAVPTMNLGSPVSERVFVVHGHDEVSKATVEQFLTEQGLTPVVLHRQPDRGMTVIEKFEQYADVGFAIILLTPDEVAFRAHTEDPTKDDGSLRARPNVLFEFGYFVGRLGRSRVCCLYTGDVELPSDVSGFLYKKFYRSVDEVFYELLKELRAAGYEI